MAESAPFGAFERMVAWRYLGARRGERFVSVIAGFSLLGIALGVATLVVVLSVMGGFQRELLARILGLNGHMAVTVLEGRIAAPETLAARIAAIPGVMRATPVVEGQVLLAGDAGTSAGGLLRGIAPDDLRARQMVAGNIRTGSLDAFSGDDAVVVGVELARRLGVSAGDQITVVSPQGRVTVFGTVPRIVSYRVVATFAVGLQDYDAGFVFMPLPAAQRFLLMPNAATQIEVELAEPERGREVAAAIRRASPETVFRIIDWQSANGPFEEVIQVQRNVMALILTLIIIVAAFNIVSALVMLVKDKWRDIAILRTMGARRGAVLRIFLLCGASIGVAGTVLGVLIGLLVCARLEAIRQFLIRVTGARLFDAEVYFLTEIPAVVRPAEVAQVVALGLVLSLLATLVPSWRAARLDPVEALRHE